MRNWGWMSVPMVVLAAQPSWAKPQSKSHGVSVQHHAKKSTPAAERKEDVLLASDLGLRVIVPKGVGGAVLTPEQIRQNVGAMDAEISKAKATDGSLPLALVNVRASIGYGCSCTPFVFDMAWAGEDDMMWPRLAKGLPEMPRVFGNFRLAGNFADNEKTGYEVLGRTPPKRLDEEDTLANRGRVFDVRGWCFEPGAVAWYQAGDLEALVRDGRLCEGVDAEALLNDIQKAVAEHQQEERVEAAAQRKDARRAAPRQKDARTTQAKRKKKRAG